MDYNLLMTPKILHQRDMNNYLDLMKIITDHLIIMKKRIGKNLQTLLSLIF